MFGEFDSPASGASGSVSGGVERDMFGREITTHSRRFSSDSPVRRSAVRRSQSATHSATPSLTPSLTPPHTNPHTALDEESPLLPRTYDTLNQTNPHSPHDPTPHTHSHTHSNTSNRVTKKTFWVTITLIILLFMSINVYFFYSLRALHTRHYHLHSQLTALQRTEYHDIHNLNRRMQKIENMTSNEDVIEELHHTQDHLEHILHKDQDATTRQMSLLQQNVTTAMNYNEYIVEKKLSTVDNKLAETTTNIRAMLAASEANMTHEIVSVSNKLEAEEKSLHILHANVTRQVAQLSDYMNSSIQSVNALVNDAKKKIKKEVNEVYASMDKYIASTTAQFAAENDFVKYQLAGSFSILACLICLYHVTSHLRHFERPDVQRRVLAILWMVPIYSVTSWLQLVFPSCTEILSGIRDCYEAYVVYTFFAFLIAVLANTKIRATAGSIGNVHNTVVKLLAQRIKDQREEESQKEGSSSAPGSPTSHSVKSSHESKHSHPISAPCSCLRCAPSKPPLPGETASSRWCFCCPGSSCVLCCCRRAPPANEGDEVEGQSINTTNPDDYDDDINSPRNVAASVLYQCSCMTLQFVLLKPLLAVIPFFFYLGGVAYEEHQYYDIETGAIDWTSPKLYVLMVANISVSLAFYGLLSFYHTTEKDLAWCDPWPKFLCIKGVVFMTFWQYVGLQMMSGMGLVDAKAASQIQNLLICIEMFMASIAHFYVFPYEEWGKNYEKEQKKLGLFRDTLAFHDFVTDIGMMTRSRPYAWEDGLDDDEDGSSEEHPPSANKISGRPRRRSSYGSTTQGTSPLTPHELEKWQHSSPGVETPGAHVMYGRPHPLGSLKQTRNIDQMLQSPSLTVSTPLHQAARDMNQRLQTRTSINNLPSEGSVSSEDSFSPHKSNEHDDDMTSEHLDTLTPAVTPVATKPYASSTIASTLTKNSPEDPGHGDKAWTQMDSVSSLDENEKADDEGSLDLSCDTDIEGFADRFLVYTSPVRSLPPDDAPPTFTPYSSVTKTDTAPLSSLTPSPPKSLTPNTQLNSETQLDPFNRSISPGVINSSIEVPQHRTPIDSTKVSPSQILPDSFLRQFSTDAATYTPSPQPPRHPATAPVQSHKVAKGVTLHDDYSSDSDRSVQSV